MISFACSHCRSPLKVAPTGRGQKVKCPRCRKVVTALEVDPRSDSSVSGIDDTMSGMKASLPDEIGSLLSPARGHGEIGWLGPYRVLKVLGHGGMGVVFHAEDPHLGRAVALKAILPRYAANPHARARFIREARVVAGLKHDHIVAIYQVGEDRGVPYQAMEYLEGQSLEQYLKRKQQMPLAEALRIGRDIADGLAEAHAHDLIHRDIKPANVWLEKKKETAAGLSSVRVKILDFGLARDGKEDTSLTQMGTIIGTPSYMAPEQAKGETVDARSDLFSLGCVLYRLATGRLPFRGENTMAILAALALEKPVPPCELSPEIPASVSDFVLKLLEKDPSHRPASAKDASETLQKLMREVKRTTKVDRTATMSATLAGEPIPPGPWRWRRWLAGIVVVIVAGVAAVMFAQRPEVKTVEPPPPEKKPQPKPQPPPPRPLDPYLQNFQHDKIAPEDWNWAFAPTEKKPREVVGLVRNRSGHLTGFAISSDGRYLALDALGSQVDLYSFDTEALRVLPRSSNTLACVFLPSTHVLFTASANGTVARRSPPRLDEQHVVFEAQKIEGQKDIAVSAFAVADGVSLVGTTKGDVFAFSPGSKDRGSKTDNYKGHLAPIAAIAVTGARPQRRIVNIDEIGGMTVVPLVKVHDPKTGEPKINEPKTLEPDYPLAKDGKVRQALAHPSAPVILVSFVRSQSIRRVEIQGKAALVPMSELKIGGDIASFALSPDGRLLATTSRSGWIQLWTYPVAGVEQRKILDFVLPPPAVAPAAGSEAYGPIQFSPDARHLLVGHPSGAVVIVRLPDLPSPPPAPPKAP